MVDFSKIKLIIWDLDCTLWDGTVSEESVTLFPQNSQFIKDVTNIGIVNSICSKNDFDVAEKKLNDLCLWDYFVFPSINWESKGNRIKEIISSMSLRPVNVLFIDDNPQNLKEAEFYCPGIMTILPEDLAPLYEIADRAEKKDTSHKRLKQYKILEEKSSYKKTFSSNEDFLMSCGIIVEINYDCINNLERIYDLVQRSNQLNYTKIRHTQDELRNIFDDDSYTCGYVTARDNFGDYGIIGFFATKENRLVHFTFSCRTLGMRIEQYVYMSIGCPELTIVGDVVETLNKDFMPSWINNSVSKQNKKYETTLKILLKGPCDMSQMFSFIEETDQIATEFSYVGKNGVLIEGHNHTAQIATSLYSEQAAKNDILNDFSWFDKDMLDTRLSTENFNYLVLSMFSDGNLGIYRRKETKELISLCEGFYDLTDKKNHQKYIDKSIFTSNIDFTEADLNLFGEKYEYVDNSDCSYSIESLDKICKKLQGTKIILILPTEKPYKGKTLPSYENRHVFHQRLNEKIRIWAENKENVVLLPIDKYIHSSKDYTDSINHFVKRVYYDLAQDIIRIIDDSSNVFRSKGKYFLIKERVFQKLRRIKTVIFSFIKKCMMK